ncbi:hypothetical protein [Aquimarina mytili]|uniref:Uncharacterized protein n=1 Tax=Aquimarina mytili TaxID=874423 RepID=A0A937DBL3_9FLAO|nr:hypothetical protein [Aquimarina mytili]MBL0684733.1 hypothetical protein [Aquimarina mytili]
MNDLRNEFNFNYVEMSWDNISVEFTLQDIDHGLVTKDSLISYAFIVDKYITNKYPRIDSLEVRKYLFSGGGGVEVMEFEFDETGNLVDTQEY